MVQAGTRWASGDAHVSGSRGAVRTKTWSNVRADASRWVNASPSCQRFREVAINEV